jgi:hypothetical protein
VVKVTKLFAEARVLPAMVFAVAATFAAEFFWARFIAAELAVAAAAAALAAAVACAAWRVVKFAAAESAALCDES